MASPTINDIDALVVPKIQDTALKLGSSTRGQSPARLDAISQARAEYEQSFPLELVVELPGNDGFDYAVSAANFPAFVDGWSMFTRVVYPSVSSLQGLQELDETEFGLVRLPTGLFLRFASDKPKATEKFLAWYTAQHTLDGSSCTVPTAHFDALATLAASYCCEKLAAIYAQVTDPAIGADVVNYRSKSADYRALAKTLHDSWARIIAVDQPARPGLAIADLNPPFSAMQRQTLLFHDTGRRTP